MSNYLARLEALETRLNPGGVPAVLVVMLRHGADEAEKHDELARSAARAGIVPEDADTVVYVIFEAAPDKALTWGQPG